MVDPFTYTVQCLHIWSRNMSRHGDFTPPCPELKRHVHLRKQHTYKYSEAGLAVWNDPIRKAAILAKRYAKEQ
jgi:hypothetical protein